MNTQPPEEPIIRLHSLFRWAIYGGIFWLLLNILIVPIGMNMWFGFSKYGRIIDEQGNPIQGVVIVSAFRSITAGFHQASFGCTDRFVTQTNAAGEYEAPSNFGLMISPSHWSWGFAPYKPGWLRKGEDDPSPPGPYTRIYSQPQTKAPRPWTLEWTKTGLRQHIPDLVMKPSALPPGERVRYLWELRKAMTCQLEESLDIAIDIFREARETLCSNANTASFTGLQLANYKGIWGEQPGVKEVIYPASLFNDAPDPWESERVKKVCELFKPTGEH